MMKKIRFILHFRPLYYIFAKKWYGIRKGCIFTYAPENHAVLLDIGFITIGYAY